MGSSKSFPAPTSPWEQDPNCTTWAEKGTKDISKDKDRKGICYRELPKEWNENDEGSGGERNCSSWRRLRRPPHKEQGKGHEVKQTLETSQHFWESGLALTCPVGGMGRAGLRGDNGGDVSGSSGAARGKTGRAETGQHTMTGNAKGYSMHLIQDCRDTGNKSRDGMGTAPGVLQPFHETRAIPIHHPPRSGGLLLLAPLDAAVDRTVCVLSMFWLDLECKKRCWKSPGCGQWHHL